tara:strand:+ start:6136 stop:6504 length:369 start_codon:yes stop_codon:yes gene_type:complete
MSFNPYKPQQITGYSAPDNTGSTVGGMTAGATGAGLAISGSLGFMDGGLATALGAGIGFLAPLIGSMFDEPPEAQYADAPEDPILQLPSPNPFQSSRGISVMGQQQPMAQDYGLNNLLGFYE